MLRAAAGALILAVVVLALACGGDGAAPSEVPGPEGGVLAVLAADGRFDTLYRIFTEDAEEHFVGYMSYADWNHTVFAPTDEAFDALMPGRLEELLAGPPRTLTRVLDCHIVPELVPEEDLQPGELRPIQCEWPVERGRDGVRIGLARIIDADIEASNGIVHAVDAVLLEPELLREAATAPASSPTGST
jgi:uncharacterized surface protein with fasciclin (FAS1) repeats